MQEDAEKAFKSDKERDKAQEKLDKIADAAIGAMAGGGGQGGGFGGQKQVLEPEDLVQVLTGAEYVREHALSYRLAATAVIALLMMAVPVAMTVALVQEPNGRLIFMTTNHWSLMPQELRTMVAKSGMQVEFPAVRRALHHSGLLDTALPSRISAVLSYFLKSNRLLCM